MTPAPEHTCNVTKVSGSCYLHCATTVYPMIRVLQDLSVHELAINWLSPGATISVVKTPQEFDDPSELLGSSCLTAAWLLPQGTRQDGGTYSSNVAAKTVLTDSLLAEWRALHPV